MVSQPSFYLPHPALAGFLSHVMIFRLDFLDGMNSISPFPPTPQNSIHFYPRDPMEVQGYANKGWQKSAHTIIVGPQVSRVNIKMGSHHLIVSVAFKPGGLYKWLGIPLSEMYDASFDATLLLGSSIREVNERLREVNTHMEMRNIINQFFMTRLAVKVGRPPFEKAMSLLLQSGGRMSMEKAADLSCLSLRQFERVAKDFLGYSPKMFARIIRFSNAYRLKEQHPKLDWSEIVYSSGYFDQMHLIRDFKQFTGANPSVISREINLSPLSLRHNVQI